MSENLAAAAAALGAPEDLVRKSAEAKAKALGGSADDFLAAWGGGAPSPAPAAAPAPETAPAEEAPPAESTPPAAEPAVPEAVAPAPVAAPALRERVLAAPPVLEGRKENPLLVMAGAVGVVLVALFLSFVAPSIPEPGNGVYTSAVPLSADGREGRNLYRSEGCAVCHTQVVRPLVIDAGLGGVTVSDTNQVIGTRRFGPDLAHVGSRLDPSTIRAALSGIGDHPPYLYLSESDFDRIVAYMVESK